MKKTILFSSLLVGVIMTGCQKQPEASFTTDKSTYIAGETVKLTNTSINDDSYLWTFPDGQTGTIANYNYTLDVNEPSGTLTFKLKVFSKNGKKSDETLKSITVQAATGDVSFWQNGTPSYYATDVTVSGYTTKTITMDFPSGVSGCSTSGCANYTLPVGTYNFTAAEQSPGTATWSGTLTVTAQGCLQKQLL